VVVVEVVVVGGRVVDVVVVEVVVVAGRVVEVVSVGGARRRGVLVAGAVVEVVVVAGRVVKVVSVGGAVVEVCPSAVRSSRWSRRRCGREGARRRCGRRSGGRRRQVVKVVSVGSAVSRWWSSAVRSISRVSSDAFSPVTVAADDSVASIPPDARYLKGNQAIGDPERSGLSRLSKKQTRPKSRVNVALRRRDDIEATGRLATPTVMNPPESLERLVSLFQLSSLNDVPAFLAYRYVGAFGPR